MCVCSLIPIDEAVKYVWMDQHSKVHARHTLQSRLSPFYVRSDLYFIQDDVHVQHRTHAQHTHARIETPIDVWSAPWCMLRVHSFINKFSHYRSFGDDFSSLLFGLCHWIFLFFPPKIQQSNRALNGESSASRAKNSLDVYTASIHSAEFFFYSTWLPTPLRSLLPERQKLEKMELRRCEIVDCIVWLPNSFFGSSISWHADKRQR